MVCDGDLVELASTEMTRVEDAGDGTAVTRKIVGSVRCG